MLFLSNYTQYNKSYVNLVNVQPKIHSPFLNFSIYIIYFRYFNSIFICYFLEVVTRNASVSVSIRNFPFQIVKFRIYSCSWIHEIHFKLQFQTKNKLFEVFVKVTCPSKYIFYIYIITHFLYVHIYTLRLVSHFPVL